MQSIPMPNDFITNDQMSKTLHVDVFKTVVCERDDQELKLFSVSVLLIIELVPNLHYGIFVHFV